MIQPVGGSPSSFVTDRHHRAYRLPFAVSADSLRLRHYSGGQLKQAAVALTCTYRHQSQSCEVSANHPGKFLYYHIYLVQYRQRAGGSAGHVRLMLVRQPLQWLVYSGLCLLSAAALWRAVVVLLRGFPRRHAVHFAIAAVLVAALIVFCNPMMRRAAVPPVLRSVWFLPHVAAYILSFAFLALSFAGSARRLADDHAALQQRVDRRLQCGTALFTVGLALGMVWAKAAWGNFWSWDPKETAALVAWAAYTVCAGLSSRGPLPPKRGFALQLLAFLSLLMCWFGIRWLPRPGLHV